LERLRDSRDQSFKEIVNDVLRLGLQSMAAPSKCGQPFQTHTANLGRCRLTRLDNVAEALAIAEGDAFR
jgi:hypothetical protein